MLQARRVHSSLRSRARTPHTTVGSLLSLLAQDEGYYDAQYSTFAPARFYVSNRRGLTLALGQSSVPKIGSILLTPKIVEVTHAMSFFAETSIPLSKKKCGRPPRARKQGKYVTLASHAPTQKTMTQNNDPKHLDSKHQSLVFLRTSDNITL